MSAYDESSQVAATRGSSPPAMTVGAAGEPVILVVRVAVIPLVEQEDPEAVPMEHPGGHQDVVVAPAAPHAVHEDHGRPVGRPARDPPGAEHEVRDVRV